MHRSEAKKNKSTARKYLDLSSLRPGDVLLTSERTHQSRGVIFGQMLLHGKLFPPFFSHASIVISNTLIFDTTGKVGARFRTMSADRISEESGVIRLWHDVSDYMNIVVVRYGETVDSHSLLDAALTENTTEYPPLRRFTSLLLPPFKHWIDTVCGWVSKEGIVGQEKFCSSLAVHLLQMVGAGNQFKNSDPGAISPMKLYDPDCVKADLVMTREDDSFAGGECYQELLNTLNAITGHLILTDPDAFEHRFEDVMKIVANGTLVWGMLASDPSFNILRDGGSVSLMEHPHLAQYERVKRLIDSGNAFFNRIDEMVHCFTACEKCTSAACCEKDADTQMAELLSSRPAGPHDLQ